MSDARASTRARVALALALGACGAAQRPPAPDVRALVRAAEDAERARRHDIARAKYEQAIAGARDAASLGFAKSRFGETLATWGEYAEAEAQLEGATRATPGEPSAWNDLGILREHRGDSRGAIAALEHAKAIVPTDWRPHIALGVLHWRLAAACVRATPASPACATEVAAAKAEYQALLALDLPPKLRAEVEWALAQLASPDAGVRPAS